MVYSLLQEIEMAVSSSRHGLRVLHKLLERAQDLYDEVNQRISRVETTGNWDDYQVYTQAIDPLERVLLDAIPAIYDDRIHLTAPVSSDDLIELAEEWFINSRIICECLRRLRTEAELQGLASSSRDVETEILAANAQDRYDLFNKLVLEISETAALCTQPNLRVLLKYVNRSLQSAQIVYAKDPLKVVDDEWCIASVKCAMLTRGMLINLTQAPTPHNLPNDFGWGGMIWKRVLEMLSLINKALPPEPPASPAPGPPPRGQRSTKPKSRARNASTTEKPQSSPPLSPESTEKPQARPALSVDTQLLDLSWATFKRLQDPFPDPHTPTHTQRLSQYEKYNSAVTQSPSPVFSISVPTPVIVRTPIFQWLPGLQVALALRSSAPLPHTDSVCGRLPLYRFLASSFRANS
ncbi:hypothetical protein RSOL_313390 [Rhizoctonia solani AG-3 Rhs1AP]|uniref:Uncharacterized protein n=1 Tax=Rhizoctonia solani AG-3 Rhs1AP TaxID=1086054 RepID=A0A0A1UK31_9AGAM|nr:hypothetical protein RSOL_313390 [Rhizoctonia solani AG-3 Rhs1AP]